jgi:hypothetical protein
MTIIDKMCTLLLAQIKKPSVKLQKTVKLPKIQDNNQSIKLGAINEINNSNLRSKARHP